MQRVQSATNCGTTTSGITSAHAESTYVIKKLFNCFKDHLCACREYRGLIDSETCYKGSPLRMQRVPGICLTIIGLMRITSAHAESTRVVAIQKRTMKDHLCACREYLPLSSRSTNLLGSPLRMQRVHNASVSREMEEGITSAHAESTFSITVVGRMS